MSTLLRRWSGSLFVASLLELMMFFPVVLALYVWKPPGTLQLPVVAFLLLVAYWLGYGINALLKFRRSFPKILLGILVAAGAGVPLLGITEGSIALMLLGVCAVYRGSRLPGMSLAVRLTAQDFIVGVIFYFVGSILQSIKHLFDDYRLPYLVAGLLTLIVSLFLTNRNVVGRETLSGTDKPAVEPSVRRNNRIFVGIAMVVTVLIALSYQLQLLFGQAWHAIAGWLSRLFSSHGDAQNSPPQPAVQQPPERLPLSDATKTLPAWLNIILYGIVIAVVMVLLFLLLRRLNRLPGWLRELHGKFLQLFHREKGVPARGYVDQVERIKKPERSMRKRQGRAKEDRLKWKELSDNEARLRYLYRRWVGHAVSKGFRHRPSMTPQEIRNELLRAESTDVSSPADAEALVRYYQDIRYGKGKLTDEQLQALVAELGRVKL